MRHSPSSGRVAGSPGIAMTAEVEIGGGGGRTSSLLDGGDCNGLLGLLAGFSRESRSRWPERRQRKQRTGSRHEAALWSGARHTKHLPSVLLRNTLSKGGLGPCFV